MLLRKELIMAAKDSFHTTMQEHNTIQLYCFCAEKFAFWLVIYIKTFNKINNKHHEAALVFSVENVNML